MIMFREINIADYEQFRTLNQSLQEIHYVNDQKKSRDPSEIVSKQDFEKLIKSDKELIGLEYKDKLIGYFAIKEVLKGKAKLKNPRRCLEVLQIYIQNRYKRNGLGATMILKIKSIAKDRGVKDIELATYPSNKDAINFYKSFGFKDDSKTMYLSL